MLENRHIKTQAVGVLRKTHQVLLHHYMYVDRCQHMAFVDAPFQFLRVNICGQTAKGLSQATVAIIPQGTYSVGLLFGGCMCTSFTYSNIYQVTRMVKTSVHYTHLSSSSVYFVIYHMALLFCPL